MAHARAGRELPLAPCCYTAGFEDVYIQQSAILSLPVMILKPREGLKSHEAEQPFCLRFLGTGTGSAGNTALPEESSPRSAWPPAPLTFILFNSRFYKLFRFFCPIVPPLQKGRMALKTAKS